MSKPARHCSQTQTSQALTSQTSVFQNRVFQNKLSQNTPLAACLSLLLLLFFPHNSVAFDEVIIEDVDLYALDDDIKRMLDNEVRPIRTKEDKVSALHDLLFTQYGEDIKYDFVSTRTAQETFDQKSGNCLSLAILFMAASKYLGIKAHYQKVKVPQTWEREANYLLVPRHVNVVVPLVYGNNATIEFTSTFTGSSRAKTRKIGHRKILSDYYNNLGSVALTRSDYPLAIGYFKKALKANKTDAAWSNLGIAYKKVEAYDLAEKAYKKALKKTPSNLSVISNLYALYRQTGQDKKANKYISKVEKYGRKNPYKLQQLAELEINQKNYTLAQTMIKKAIQIKPSEAVFHHVLAQTHFYLEQPLLASQQVAIAADLALEDRDKQRYLNKLSHLNQWQKNQAATN